MTNTAQFTSSDWYIGYCLYADGHMPPFENAEQMKGYENARRGHNASMAYDACGNDDAKAASLLRRYPIVSGNDAIDADIAQTQREMAWGLG